MSYDDDRHHDFHPRGFTPPGRRASNYGSKRPLTLDLFDHREEQAHQERLEREEIRREILSEDRRKEELRDSVARQMEREANDARRRERMMGARALLYDERPGRWARGYDNDRFGGF